MSEHFNIAVIGAGPGGYVAALKAGQMGAKVAVIEKHHLGGTCLNYGCIPSKALLASAELLHKIKTADALGINIESKAAFDWSKIQQRKDKVLNNLRTGIKGLFRARGATLYQADAKFVSAGKMLLANNGTSQEITADNIIIAAGSVPSQIPGWPTDKNFVCTSDEALHWEKLPAKLVIVGGGVIGCEFACMMAEFGVEVTIIEMQDNLLPEMDSDLGQALIPVFKNRNIKIFISSKVENISIKDNTVNVQITGGHNISADKVLVATGRKPNTAQLAIDKAGLAAERGFIRVNEKMQTPVKGIYCIGDANGKCLLAHAASAHGITAVENALGKQTDFDWPIPAAVYTFPEIASVGLSTKQASEKNIPVAVGKFPIRNLGKAMAVCEEFGFVKVIRHLTENTLLGVHIIGHNATEMIHSAAAMIGMKASAKDLGEMVFAHPTISEAVKEAAEDSFSAALHIPPKKIIKVTAEIEKM
ncbi:MAG: dihydrolipoyl dehydrogenase [Phycisphaerales bacterium]